MSRPQNEDDLGESQPSALRSRAEALRQSADLPGAELRTLFDAALAELDVVISVLAELPGRRQADDPPQLRLRSERRLLQALFQQAPIALFLLGLDGTIRRSNAAAASMLGTSPGYPTGKLFTALVEQRSRAAVHSQLAAAAQTGQPRTLTCKLITAAGSLACAITATSIAIRGDDDLVLLAVQRRASSARAARGDAGITSKEPSPPAEGAVAAITRRLDAVMALNRLLIEDIVAAEGTLLWRVTRLLADHLRSWALVDIKDDDRLHRRCVAAPDEADPAAETQQVMAADPDPESLPGQVAASGSAQLLAHAEDPEVLGLTGDGVPLLLVLDGSSVLSVPIAAAGVTYGALTLVRDAVQGPFGLADAGLAEEAAEQLGRALGMNRLVKRRTEEAEALQESLLPAELPSVPGVGLAASHLPATTGWEVGGDFYGCYPAFGGWGISMGSVTGTGLGVAAVAAARHAIRALGHSEADPGTVLLAANDLMLPEPPEQSIATALAAHLSWPGGVHGALHVRIASAGHPGPALITADGRVQLIDGGGLPLGSNPDAELAVTCHELDLGPGDLLLFYTSGLTAARGTGSGLFGDGLADALAELARDPPAGLVTQLAERLVQFSGGILARDVSMLALQASAGPPSPPPG